MNLLKASASVFAISAIAALAACGGGGGGGSVTPPANPGGPSSAPSSSVSPTPSPTPTATPTAVPTTVPVSTSTIYTYEGVVLGDQSWYTSGTASWSNHSGGTSTAPGASANVDGMSCTNFQEPSTTNTYGQHAFVGIMYNGTIEALPQALGIVNPQPPTTPYPGNPSGHAKNTDAVEVADCKFNVHTHDYSGLVHVADASQPQSLTAVMPYATLQSLFDVWGAQLTATGIVAGSNTLTGPVQIYTGAPTGKYTPPGSSKTVDLVNSYTLVTGPPSSVTFSHHTATWIVIGTPPANGLPQIAFGMDN